MTLPTAVNDQITDSVIQANLETVASSPALSLSNLYHLTSQSLGLVAQNAVTSQQQASIIQQTSTTQGLDLIFSMDVSSSNSAAFKISQANTPASVANILGVVKALKGLR